MSVALHVYDFGEPDAVLVLRSEDHTLVFVDAALTPSDRVRAALEHLEEDEVAELVPVLRDLQRVGN